MPDFTPAASAAEDECREFAAEFPTANTLRAIALCEDGTLAWTAVRGVFARALTQGVAAVAS